ncbi:LysR substrate-binding domain-containing protein [Acetobacter fabarum]|uniref:LysR substrate-binding domain-containing protein n=1 Tax=Acetobacter fabarum TaxID=483199 RepID=UPI00222F5A9E|nr:LysR substrate-binding domain-containing protein [Acetobacter fabarum]
MTNISERLIPLLRMAEHICIAVRAPTRGSIYAWEFEKDGDELKIKVQGQFTSNSGSLAIKAAIAGLGIAFVPDFHAEAAIKAKQVKILLEDWCQPFPGFHLYYPNRRHHSPAFSLLLQELQRSRR